MSTEKLHVSDDNDLTSERSSRWKPWRKRILKGAFALFVCYLLSLVAINTPWLKSKICNKLEQRTGLAWSIDWVFYLPFGDLYLTGLNAKEDTASEQQLVCVETVQVVPSWKDLCFGKLHWNEVQTRHVVVDVDRSWLEKRVKQQQPSNQALLASKGRSQPGTEADVESKPSELPAPAHPTAKPAPVKPVSKKRPQAIASGEQNKAKKVVEQFGPTQWLRVVDLHVRLRDGDDVYFEQKGINVALPVAGTPAHGSVSYQDQQGDAHSFKIDWSGKHLALPATELAIAGLTLKVEGEVAHFHGTANFKVRAIVKEQAWHYEWIKPNLKLVLNAEKVEGRYLMAGNLLSPQTWNGIGGIEFERFSIKEVQKTQQLVEFDQVYAIGRIQHGNVLLDDARALSESLSFMANGVVQKNAYSYGVLRCVASPEVADRLNGIYHGSRAIHIDHQRYHLLENLDTPDRRYFDLYASGGLGELEVRHNRSDRWQDLKQVLEALRSFKDHELMEDGLFQPEPLQKKSTPPKK